MTSDQATKATRFRLVAFSFVLNFSYGVLLPIIPALDLEGAGLAFTLFSLLKVACLAPAGFLSDRLGHERALGLAFAVQVAALACLAAWPSAPWAGRILEGVALAQGTVSTLSMLRLVSPTPAEFSRGLSLLLGAGGVGSILGPLAGFWLLALGPTSALVALLALNGAMLVVQWAAPRARAASVTVEPAPPLPAISTGVVSTVLGLAAAKALALGWEPALAFWANHDQGLGPTLSGLTFISMGIGFTLGTARPARHFLWLGLGGFVALELSLRGVPPLWWLAAPVLGYWYGAYLTMAIGSLGWNRPDRIGRFNSAWMLVSDLPMALTPVVVWQWRTPEPGSSRLALGLVLALASVVGLWPLWRRSGKIST